ncbi:MAG: hypothetical protein ACR2P3_14335 [Geminicoccaceae bacterium]
MKSILLSLLLLVAPLSAISEDPTRPFLQMELEKVEAIPGQPIVLRVTLLVPTWPPKAPAFPSFEVPNVIARLPKRASGPTSQQVGGETWSGVTRAYRLYPMTVGRFRLPPQPVVITYADPETRAPLEMTLQTDEVRFDGIAPAVAGDLDPFIAAEALTLKQTIDGKPNEIESGEIEPGDAVTRTIKAEVKGTSPIFLPELIPLAAVERVAVYPKEPVVTESGESDVPAGERLESVTYVGDAGGYLAAPPISLRWFNLGTKQVETVELPGFEITVTGEPPPRPSAFDWRVFAAWIIAGLVSAVLVGAVGTRIWPRIGAWRKEWQDAYLHSEAFAFAKAEKAVHAHDFSGAIHGNERWSSRLLAVNGKEDRRLSDALTSLGAALYGSRAKTASNQQWSEAAGALRAARAERKALSARAKDALPPLNPHSA